MNIIYEALKKTGGKTEGDALLAAMKGMKWESPRGMMSIDPETRDIIQDIYIRKVEKINGELWNLEFARFADVKDPLKLKKGRREASDLIPPGCRSAASCRAARPPGGARDRRRGRRAAAEAWPGRPGSNR